MSRDTVTNFAQLWREDVPSIGPPYLPQRPGERLLRTHSQSIVHTFCPASGIMVDMVRPCFLVMDPEHPGSISTRKLVIETAKFNVITAYSGREAIATLERFPALDGAVLDARATDMPVDTLIERMRLIKQRIPVVVIAAPGIPEPAEANYTLESLNPRALLEVLKEICPEETDEIEQHDRDLEAEGQ